MEEFEVLILAMERVVYDEYWMRPRKECPVAVIFFHYHTGIPETMKMLD